MDGIGRDFMKATNTPQLDQSDQNKGLPCPPTESNPQNAIAFISLPDPKSLTVKGIDLRYAIENRRSVRQYANKPITIHELSYLLWCTQGVRKVTQNATYRNVPSAGTRHALETYLLINNVDGLKPGLYKYMAMEHMLAELPCDDSITQSITAACPLGKFIEASAVTFIWTAVFYRMGWRHGQRGYRYVHLDAGHVCQNLYLAVQSIDSGACGISVFKDDVINSLLGVDGEEESVIYMAAVGRISL